MIALLSSTSLRITKLLGRYDLDGITYDNSLLSSTSLKASKLTSRYEIEGANIDNKLIRSVSFKRVEPGNLLDMSSFIIRKI